MSKSTSCTICGKDKQGFVMNNKLVCMGCDELLFDLEIELDEPTAHPAPRKDGPAKPVLRTTPATKK